jgi:hypothetical protein
MGAELDGEGGIDATSGITNHRHPDRRHRAGSDFSSDPATAKSRSLAQAPARATLRQ